MSLRKNTLRAALFALMIWLAAPMAARACTCTDFKAPCRAFRETSTIFAGRVIKNSAVVGNSFRVITFEVTQAYRGVTDKTAEVLTGVGEADCGFEFLEGVNYLVYAEPEAGTGKLRTGTCTRTRLLTQAKDDIDYLAKKDDPARASGIVGDVFMQLRDEKNNLKQATAPMAGITVVISGVGTRKTVVTRKDGHFEIWGLQPGNYRISPTLAEGFKKMASTMFLPAEFSCVETTFYVPSPPKRNP